MKKILALPTIVLILSGCSASSGELVGGVMAAMPTAIDNVQREQQTGAYRPVVRPSSSTSASGIR